MPEPLTIEDVLRTVRRIDNSGSPYDYGFGYCTLCGGWWPVAEAPRGRRGRPLCPVHRILLRLRTKAARRSWKPIHGPKTYPEVFLDE